MEPVVGGDHLKRALSRGKHLGRNISRCSIEQLFQLVSLCLHLLLVSASEHQVDEPAVRWECSIASYHQFLMIKPFNIAGEGVLDRRIVRMEGLDDNLSLVVVPSRPSGDLDQQAERPFLASEVGNVHTAVGEYDADKFDFGEVETLGYHLGSEQDIDRALAELGQCLLHMAFFLGAVGIQALYPGLGEERTNLLFNHLGTEAAVGYIDAAALGTDPHW